MTKVEPFQPANKSSISPGFFPEQKNIVVTREVTITPEIASAIIDSSDLSIQRRPTQPHIAFLASQMQAGKWVLNGDSIKFDTNGNLQDGLHRLLACKKANTSFTTIAVFNLSTRAILTIDNQKRARRFADILDVTFGRLKYSSATASFINFITEFKNGRYNMAIRGGMGIHGENAYNATDIFTKVDYFSDNHEEISFFVEENVKLYGIGNRLLREKEFIGLKWVCSKKDTKMADDFFAKLSRGIGLEENTSLLYVHQKLSLARKISAEKNDKLTDIEVVNLVLKGFMLHCEGVRCKKFSISKKLPELWDIN